MTELEKYFNNDDLAADVWKSKYATKDEKTPRDMHLRMTKELARIEKNYKQTPELDTITWNSLSHFGRHLDVLDEDFIIKYLDNFKYIVPQGSIMTMLGNKYKIGSLSNCFVIPSPLDSYGGILKTDQELVQLMKRRGGVGTNINSLRPSDTAVSNAAGTSTGAVSFMHRFSNSTREVAQNGRRGALMLLISCQHPDVFKFVNVKKDRTQVTGANISVMLTDKFMEAVEKEQDFYCTFPTDANPNDIKIPSDSEWAYNELILGPYGKVYFMRIRAKELFDLIVENAWENAEPGVAFMDRVVNYSPDGVYEQFRPIASNPCGEQWMQAYDACRLLALNLFNIVKNPFTKDAKVDYNLLYEISYIQQRLADDIVDLEIEYVDRIIQKILIDPEPNEVKQTELTLWQNVKKVATESRRTGCGFTALGDMLAALGVRYDSDEAISITSTIMKTKLMAELDCSVDLAIQRGTFIGWERMYELQGSWTKEGVDLEVGGNAFYDMLIEEFPEQTKRMFKYGRRNVSWSTVAPTGTVSIMTQTTSGLEPLFMGFYMRKKKINPSNKDARIDFTDQNGDHWQEFPVLHPKFKDWIETNFIDVIDNTKTDVNKLSNGKLEELFKESPWYKSCANDISWEKRINIQSVIQRYTTNAISSTLNLPKDVSKETVAGIYMEAWKQGLKGVTIYRDGCRSGVLVADTKKESFKYIDAVKRPKDIDGNLYVTSVKGVKYGVIIGLVEDKPYEIFAFNLPAQIKDSCNGKIIKVKKGHYNFECEDGTLRNIQEAAIKSDELVLTRLVSGMLRHGAKPQFVMEQIDKCDLEVVSFGKAVSRILKKYCKEEELINRSKCSNCGSSNLRMQEGCLSCLDCSHSKCG